jgi:hypothetical protein
MAVPRPALAVLFLAVLALPAQGAEIDSVTGRPAHLDDSMRRIDARINAWIRAGVEAANRKGRACDEAQLYKQVKKAISTPFIGHWVAEELNHAEDLDRRRTRFEDSIYRDLGFFDAISVHLKDLSAVVRLRDHVVGVDKIGHFLVQGWKYFEIAYRDGDGVEAALAWGEHSERTYFGLYTTGIYSYADLAVNFDGMRFWLRLLGRERDPLGKRCLFNRPYVRCSRRLWIGKRRWRVGRKAHLSDYVSGAWDEGVNCSRYRNAEIEALVVAQIREREEADLANYRCPMAADACAAAREGYGPYAERLLHPRCFAEEPPPQPWWRFW